MCQILWYLCGNELCLLSKGFSWSQFSQTYIMYLFPEDNVICKISFKIFFLILANSFAKNNPIFCVLLKSDYERYNQVK